MGRKSDWLPSCYLASAISLQQELNGQQASAWPSLITRSTRFVAASVA